ncbi:Ger(x)C family spore germination C-terminal domain-containing protein [Paenibacillus pini]|uniref:Spore germination protein GerKC n=1 Tax=Paenibacillus pini JCM 16418 TaxID=1236976 RepID=W7YXD6_9BACL|nr:Ger(x)C family spore germination C-terminal domain-containing protein [Paenibacillus pini]GAF09366.1 spore germination protein GerKC [Paenibacillus pini JCM 16418]
MISRTDETIPDAIRNIQKDLTRHLSFGHTREITVGRDYAEAGIGDLLDWMDKEPNFHISSFLTTAHGKAKDIAQLIPLYEQMPAEVLRKMTLQHIMFSTSVRDILISTYSKVGFATNYLSIRKEAIPSENDKQEKWAGIQGAALYQEDKMKGTLNVEDARAIAWANGRLGKQAFSVTWDEGKSRASVLFNKLKATRKVKMTKKGPQFMIKLYASGNLIYKKDTKKRNDTELTHLITKLLNSKIEEDLSSAITMTKRVGADALKLGTLLEWKYPGYWKNIQEDWSEYYKNQSDIRIQTKVDVIYTTNQP